MSFSAAFLGPVDGLISRPNPGNCQFFNGKGEAFAGNTPDGRMSFASANGVYVPERFDTLKIVATADGILAAGVGDPWAVTDVGVGGFLALDPAVSTPAGYHRLPSNFGLGWAPWGLEGNLSLQVEVGLINRYGSYLGASDLLGVNEYDLALGACYFFNAGEDAIDGVVLILRALHSVQD